MRPCLSCGSPLPRSTPPSATWRATLTWCWPGPRAAARAGARLVVFPEMVLTGYPVEDLALRASFVEASVAALHGLAARLRRRRASASCRSSSATWTAAPACAPRVGLPAGAPQDAAALLHGGQVVVTSAKHHLPNYGVFDEYRYFVPGDRLPVFRLPTGGEPSTWRSPSARTCGRTAARSRSRARPGPGCWWCPTPRRTSRTRTTSGCELCAAPGPRGRAARWPTSTMVGGQDELVFDGDSIVVDAAGELLAPRAAVRARRCSSPTWTCRPPTGARPGREPADARRRHRR